MSTVHTDVQTRIGDLLSRFPITDGRIDLIVEVGSTAHNISAGSDDLDLTAIWTERLIDMMAPDSAHGTKMLRTAAEGARSQPGDIDLNVYSMRKFAALCVKGNPSILNTLFIPGDKVVLERTRVAPMTMDAVGFPRERLAELSHTRSAGIAYLGYMESQLKRWNEGKIAQRVNRPEEVEQYGYAVKYAAHAIRLGIQGSEFLTTGRIQIPMAEENASVLRQIRRGEVSETAAWAWAVAVQEQLGINLENTDLPKSPDYPKVHRFLADWHANRDV